MAAGAIVERVVPYCVLAELNDAVASVIEGVVLARAALADTVIP